MVVWSYFAAFMVSLFVLAVYMMTMQRRSFTYFGMLFTVLTISVGGYLALVTADSLGAAQVAMKLVYTSGCFMPLLCFLNILTLCKLRLPKPVVSALIGFCSVLYVSVLGIGYNSFFYTSTKLEIFDGISNLVRTYGPMHTVYTVQLIAFNAASFLVILVSILERYNVSRFNTITLFGLQMIVMIMYFAEQRLKFGMEWMPFLYVAIEVILFHLLLRFEKYDVEGAMINIMEQQGTNGIVLLSPRLRYMGCNPEAESLAPVLKTVHVDSLLDEDALFENLKEHIAALNENGESETWYQQIAGNELRITMYYMIHRGKKAGFVIDLMDDTQQQEALSMLNDFNDELTVAVNMQMEQIQAMQTKIIYGVAELIENRDNMTGGHVKRTSDAVRILVDAIQQTDHTLPAELCENIIKAAPMHDLGKIAIDDAILKKSGRFTPEEFDQMKAHSASGAVIVREILDGVEDEAFVKTACNIAHFHHEKWDGTGYPDHLAGEDIPIEARIMAFADVFDALVSKRAYKEAMSYDTAFGIIQDSLGTQFDPEIGKIFMNCRPLLEEYYDQREDLQ